MNRLTSKSSAIDALQTFAQAQTIFNTHTMTRTTNPDPELESAHQALDRLGAPYADAIGNPITISERIRQYDARKVIGFFPFIVASELQNKLRREAIMVHFKGQPPYTIERLGQLGQPDHSRHVSAAIATEVEFARETVGTCLAPGPDEREKSSDYKARTGRDLGGRYRVSVENFEHRFAGTPLREVRVDTKEEIEAVRRYEQLCKDVEESGSGKRVALLCGTQIIASNVRSEILVTHAPLFRDYNNG